MADGATPKQAFIYARDGLDFYTEPRWCVDLLIDAERFAGKVWDPACGNGTIGRAFAARNHPIRSTDIAPRPYAERQLDFLDASDASYTRPDHIVCNPPFSQAEAFVRRGIEVAKASAAFLLPLKWLASETRQRFFSEVGRPARVYVLANRASMPPGDYLDAETGLFAFDDPHPHPAKGPRWKAGDAPSGGAIDYCWFVFVPGYGGPTDLRWLSRVTLDRPLAGRPRTASSRQPVKRHCKPAREGALKRNG
jgi:hypothetical protein